MQYRRKIALLMSLLMAASALIGCSEEPAETTAETTASTESTSFDEIDFDSMSLVERMQYSRAEIPDGLPEKDYDGYTFTIQECTGELSSNSAILRNIDDTGEAVSASMYNRQLAIEDRFNIVFEDSGLTGGVANFDDFFGKVNAVFFAQEDTIDLIKIWNTMAQSWVPQGYLSDLSQIDVLDFSKPWFYQDATNSLSYKNHIYLSVDMSIPFFESLVAVYYNKEKALDFGIDGLYDTVRNGEWTVDYFKSLVQDVWVDTNGNGVREIEFDTFGANMTTAEFGFTGIPTFGVTLISKDESDVPILNVDSNLEQFVNVFTDMRNLIMNTDGVVGLGWEMDQFLDNRALFAVRTLSSLNSLRDVDFNYGVLPLFKWDENQENYSSAYLPSPNAIPTTVQDVERSAIILSALASTGYKEVLPVYYDNALKTKLVRDEDSAEMMDIISENIVVDGSLLYMDSGNGIYFFHFFTTETKEFASFYASRTREMQSFLDGKIADMEDLLARSEG